MIGSGRGVFRVGTTKCRMRELWLTEAVTFEERREDVLGEDVAVLRLPCGGRRWTARNGLTIAAVGAVLALVAVAIQRMALSPAAPGNRASLVVRAGSSTPGRDRSRRPEPTRMKTHHARSGARRAKRRVRHEPGADRPTPAVSGEPRRATAAAPAVVRSPARTTAPARRPSTQVSDPGEFF